jgi:hypothetical protein
VTVRGWPLATLMLVRRRLTRLIKQNALLWAAFSRIRSLGGGNKTSDEAPAERKSPSIVPE